MAGETLPVPSEYSTIQAASDMAGNLAANPGFETNTNPNGVPDFWIDQFKGVSKKLDSSQKHSGSYSWKFVGAPNDDSGAYSDFIPVNRRKYYCLSTWLKTELGTERVYIGWEEYDANKNSLSWAGIKYFVLNNNTMPTTWSCARGVFSPVNPNTVFIRLRFFGPYRGIGTVWWDDFDFREAESLYLSPYGPTNDGVSESVRFGGVEVNTSWISDMTGLGDATVDTGDQNITYRVLKSGRSLTIQFPGFNTGSNGFPNTPMLLEIMYKDTVSDPDQSNTVSENRVVVKSKIDYLGLDTSYINGNRDWTVGYLGGKNDGQWQYKQIVFQKSNYQLIRSVGGQYTIKLYNQTGMDMPIDYISLRSISQGDYEVLAGKQRAARGFFEVSPPNDVPSNPSGYSNITLFTRDIMRPVYQQTQPSANEILNFEGVPKILEVSAAKGVMEPVNFAVYTENPEGVDVAVSVSDLKYSNNTIPCNRIGVYHVVNDYARLEYVVKKEMAKLPLRLEPFTSLHVASKTSERIWLKINVPSTALPGVYQGAITISSGGTSQSLVLKLNVLDITLSSPENDNFVYHDPFSPTNKLYSEKRDNVLDAYVEAGLEPIVGSYYVLATGLDSKGVPILKTDKLEAALDTMIQKGMARKYIHLYSYNAFNILYYVLNGVTIPTTESSLYSLLSNTKFVAASQSVMAAYNSIAAKRGLTFIHHVTDEPGDDPRRRILCDRLSRIIQKYGGKTGATYYGACDYELKGSALGSYVIPASDPLDATIKLNGVLPPLTNRIDYKIWNLGFTQYGIDQRSSGNYGSFGYYTTGASHMKDMVYNRFLHGLYAWATGAKAVGAYAMGDYIGDPYNDFDDDADMVFPFTYPDFVFAYPTWSGDLYYSMGGLEAIREGIKDAKYYATLKALIASNPQTPAAIEAQSYLENLKSRIKTDYLNDYALKPTSWGYQAEILKVVSDTHNSNDYEVFTQIRNRVANYIVQMNFGNNNFTPDLNMSPGVIANQKISFTVAAAGATGQNLIYTVQNLPSGATFINNVFEWTPDTDDVGLYQITFVVSDGTVQDSRVVTITVTAPTTTTSTPSSPQQNNAPVLTAIGNKSVNENQTLTFTVNATDSDGDALTYSAGTLPTGATFANKTFTWKPGYSDAGSYLVTFTVSDGQNQAQSTITITVVNVNRAPVLTSIDNKTVVCSHLLTFAVTASDPDGGTVTCSATNLPSGAVFSNNILSWTPTSDQIGSYQTTFTASDGSLTASQTVTLSVTAQAGDMTPPLVENIIPASNASQVPPNSLVVLNIIDAGQGVNPASVVIRVNNQIVYQGDVTDYTGDYGRCRRKGDKAGYIYTFQPQTPFNFDHTVPIVVNASDLNGNPMPTFNSTFATQTYAFKESLAVNSGVNSLPQGKPVTAVAPNGDIWVAWDAGDVGQRDIYINMKSAQAGQFHTPLKMTDGTADYCSPAIAVDSNGVIYLAWQDNRAGNWGIYVGSCADGVHWGNETRITDSIEDAVHPVLAADSNGKVWLAWEDHTAGNWDIYAVYSTDRFVNGVGGPIANASGDQTQPALALDADNNLYAVWTDHRNASADIYAASSQNAFVNVPLVNSAANQTQPCLAYDSAANNFHLAWVEDTVGHKDIYYAAASNINSPITGRDIIDDTVAADHCAPSLVVSQSRVFVCWCDARNSSTNPSNTNLYFAEVKSSSGTNVPVSSSAAAQSQSVMAVNSQNEPVIFWSSRLDSTNDVLYAELFSYNGQLLAGNDFAAAVGGIIGTPPDQISTVDDVSIDIPANAFWDNVYLTITRLNDSLAGTSTGFIAAYEFGPSSGLEFSQPVTTTIPYSVADAEAPSAVVYWYNPQTGSLSQSGISHVENIVISSSLRAIRFKTTHFSQYIIAYPKCR